MLFVLSMYDLSLPPAIRVLKRGTVKEKRFCEFVILALFKETSQFIQTNGLVHCHKNRSFAKASKQFQKNRTKDFEKSCVTCYEYSSRKTM